MDDNNEKLDGSKTIFGIGNPLLDIQAKVTTAYLEKYQLESNHQILAEEKHLKMYQEIVDLFPVEYLPGGATLNTMRIAKWMLGTNGVVRFSGAIGSDAFGENLESQIQKSKIESYLVKQKALPTGTCASMVNCIGHRSLIANLAAAESYKTEFLNDENIWKKVTDSQIFYSAGFFLTPEQGLPTLMKIAQHAQASDKIFCMNISAKFICRRFSPRFHAILPYCDFIFGNEAEAEAYASHNGLGKGLPLEEIAQKMAQYEKINSKRPRYVIITQGPEKTIVATGESAMTYPVPHVDSLVDTNGAGDAFVAGFLSQLALNKSISECVQAGHWAAGIIIQNPGCTFPRDLISPFTY